MITTLVNVVSDINQKKKTGMLSIMVKVSKQLFKIYFEDGEIYQILYGNLKNSDCLSDLERLEFADCFFFSGAKSNTVEKLNIPTSEIIGHLRATGKTVECKDLPANAAESLQASPGVQDKLKVALLRQIGPVAEIVFPKVIGKWAAASPPTKQNLLELIELLKKEIDDPANSAEFVKEANKIIS